MTEEFAFQYNGFQHKVTIGRLATTWEINYETTRGHTEVFEFERYIPVKTLKKSDFLFKTYKRDKEGNISDVKNRGFEYRIFEDEFLALWDLNLSNIQTEKAIMNGLIARITSETPDPAEDGIKPFDPATGFLRANPITWNVVATPRTDPETDDALLTGTITYQLPGGTTEYRFTSVGADNVETVVRDWAAGNIQSGLGAGKYRCYVRQVFDFGQGEATGIGATYEFIIN